MMHVSSIRTIITSDRSASTYKRHREPEREGSLFSAVSCNVTRQERRLSNPLYGSTAISVSYNYAACGNIIMVVEATTIMAIDVFPKFFRLTSSSSTAE